MPYLLNSIDCFLNQSYPHRELVILYKKSDSQLESELKNKISKYEFIKPYAYTETKTLGALRNLSRRIAISSYQCQWDDDDLFHIDRLQLQLDTLLKNKAKACFLDSQYIHIKNKNKTYLVKTDKVYASILYIDSFELAYPEIGSLSHRGEDVAFSQQFSNIDIAILKGHPLRTRIFHGKNVTPEKDLFRYLEVNNAKIV